MKKVLIIDDELLMRNAVAGTLHTHGYEVFQAETAMAGLTLALEQRPDLVVCDFQFERGNGLEVLRELRGQPTTATLPFILITGQPDAGLMRQGMDLGADDFLRKPFTDNQLLAAVQARLRQHDSYQASADQTNARLLTIIEATPDLVAIFQPESLQIVHLNHAGRRMIGLPQEADVTRFRLHDFYPGHELPSILCERLPQAMAHGDWTGDAVLLTRQARELPVTQQILAHHGSDGRVEYLSTLARDITLRKRAEMMLRLQTAAMDAAANGIVITDAQGSILMANQAFTTLTGYTALEAQGANPRVLKSGHHDATFYRSMWQTILKGNVWQGELVNRRKDGTHYPEEMTITPVRDEQGQIANFIAIKRDISERRRTEERLRASEALYHSLIEDLPLCLFCKDLSGRFTFANTRFCQVIQRTWEEIQGHTDFDLFPAELAAAYQADDRRVVEGGQVLEIVERNVTPDGAVHSVKVIKSPVRNASGQVTGLQGIFWDITEQLRAEAALRESEQRFRVLFENASDALMVLAQGRFTACNPATLKLFGIATLAEFIGLHPSQLSPRQQSGGQDSMGAAQARMAEAVEHGRTTFEWLHQRADGEIFPAEVTLTAFQHRDQPMIQAAVRDLSERKQAERQSAILEVQLRQAQKLESIGQLAAGIAHEINTPIQYVGDNLRFLQDAFTDLNKMAAMYRKVLEAAPRGEITPELLQAVRETAQSTDVDYLSAEVPKAVQQALEGVERVAKIVRAMKEFSHPGAQEKALVDLKHAIETTVTVARNEWKYVAELVLELDPDLPPVPCLPGELNQVILNLIVNAAHAIADVVGDGGRGKGTITLTARRQGEWVEIRIQDTGTGIPEKARGRIFDPFFTTKPVGKGTGQGLAIAHSVVVDKHRGTIAFETELGQGTTFIIRLPLSSPDRGRDPLPGHPAKP